MDSTYIHQVLDTFRQIKELSQNVLMPCSVTGKLVETDMNLSDETIAALTAAAISRENYSFYETRDNNRSR